MHSKSADAPSGYDYEGVSTHLFSSPAPGLEALHMVFSPLMTDHMPTTNPNEGSQLGYGNLEVLGYCSPVRTSQTPHPFQRAVHEDGFLDHFCTKDQGEIDVFPPSWKIEQVTCWVP